MADVLRTVKMGSFLSRALLRIRSVVKVTVNRVSPSRRLSMRGKRAYALRVMPMVVRAMLPRSDFLKDGKKKSEE